MSREVPEHIGELSRYALQEAIDRVDRELADGPQEVRDAVSVIRLVVNMSRQVPWFGVHVPTPEGDSVSVGTILRNAFTALGDTVDRPAPDGFKTTAEHSFTRRWLPQWRAGRRDYDDYLEHLTDPERWERECAERRLRADEAAVMRQSAAAYLSARGMA